MAKYILKGDYPLKYKGKLHQPGATIDMPEDEAARLVESGRLAVSPAPAGAGPGQAPNGRGGKGNS